jgi:hypothetical protein
MPVKAPLQIGLEDLTREELLKLVKTLQGRQPWRQLFHPRELIWLKYETASVRARELETESQAAWDRWLDASQAVKIGLSDREHLRRSKARVDAQEARDRAGRRAEAARRKADALYDAWRRLAAPDNA